MTHASRFRLGKIVRVLLLQLYLVELASSRKVSSILFVDRGAATAKSKPKLEMGNQTSATARQDRSLRRSNSIPRVFQKKPNNEKHAADDDDQEMDTSTQLRELANAYSTLNAVMDQSSSRRTSSSSTRRSSQGGSSSRRRSSSGSRLGMSLRRKSIQEDPEVDGTAVGGSGPPAEAGPEHQEARNPRRERRRNKHKATTTGEAHPRRRSRSSNSGLVDRELKETQEFLELLASTPSGNEKLRQMMVDQEALGTVVTVPTK